MNKLRFLKYFILLILVSLFFKNYYFSPEEQLGYVPIRHTFGDVSYKSYKSFLIGKKFKTKNPLIYLDNSKYMNQLCSFIRNYKAPIRLVELQFESNYVVDSSCYFKKTFITTSLVPIGTEFEIIDSFVVSGLLNWNRVEYVVLKDKAGNVSEASELFIKMEISSTRKETEKAPDEEPFYSDLDYLKKNKKLNMFLCNLYNDLQRVEKFPDYKDEVLNKETVLRRTPFIELPIQNFLKVFGLENEVKILELSWFNREKWKPCILLSFQTERSYITSMYHMQRWGIPLAAREFASHEKYEIFDVSKFYYNRSPLKSELNNFRSDYKNIDIDKLSSMDIYNYRRLKAP